ncbi:MAG: hypothetical protein CL840_01240 [Crocinitomicaceae bacterium]|jgi:hypothetical protein|nr:hypothetical protein [Crocinitomicaceae bacterium]|tara:strand:+ start:38745 stop:39116 length:372 start_codon:yes stop_codon:yes gene_type:complete
MTIEFTPGNVERDEHGYWTDPRIPQWDESAKSKDIDKWFEERNLGWHIDSLESSGTEEQNERFGDGECGIPDWEPKCDIEGAFLLAIYDTEDGLRALFAYPKGTSTVLNTPDGTIAFPNEVAK